MTAPLSPEETAAALEAAGQTDAAHLIRAMTAELATLRAEHATLSEFTRSMASLPGDGYGANVHHVVRAKEALDTLRVYKRCPNSLAEDGRHRWSRDWGNGSRCFRCHARKPVDWNAAT